MSAMLATYQKELYVLCEGLASTSDEPVCLTELVEGSDLDRLKLSAMQGIMAHVERDALQRGARITAMGPVQFCVTPKISPAGSFRVLAHVRYARRRS